MVNNFYLLNKHYLFALLAFFVTSGLWAQSAEKCNTVPYEISRLNGDYELYLQAFEEYINQQRDGLPESSNTVYTIPIVMHVIHDGDVVGTGDNLSQALLDAQLEQLNNDFRRIMGTTGFGNGVDTRIEFCAATIDPDGNTMPEPGINRIDRNDEGWTSPPYGNEGFLCLNPSFGYVDGTIKPQSIWDPEEYCNVWILDLVCGVLGYAQFPEAPTLAGIGTGNGGANSDGVVVLPSSVGSSDVPNPAGGVFGEGRTLTHELGHWLGLRHIWGDGGCNVDDFCADTPNAGSSTSGCPANKDSCPDPGVDQIENYMDYSNDACMNIFTENQRERMEIVMGGGTASGSPRREILLSSNVCGNGSGVAPAVLNLNDNPIAVDQYCATNNIQSSGTVNVSGNQQMIFQAGSFVQLNPGFSATVSGNGSFIARIGTCNNARTIENRTEEVTPSTVVTDDIQVFPNPFHTETQIQLNLAAESQVAIELVDFTGRRIRTVATPQQHTAGEHNFYLEATGLESGMYILLVHINDRVQAQKVSIIR
ncbi:MAG: M43 family zinc metalloprotease [Bacteroidota bacterium]